VATWVTRIAAMTTLLGGTNDTERIDVVISLFAIAQMVTGVGATLALFWIDVRLMQAELSRVAHSDALTGLPNRRAVLMRFQEEASRASRHGQRFALAIFDLDHFKQVNDRHGHAVGDEVLRAAADAFAGAKRGEDILSRIGGEEFLVVLSSQQSMEGALEAAERMREAIGRIQLRAGRDSVRLTVSGGVALYPDDGTGWDALFTAADRRLYAAKDAGRDRVAGRDRNDKQETQ
jgi:diguanylate cyclase (GGDEF)-like protein